MIYAISTEGDKVSLHFGRAQQFTIIIVDKGKLIEKKVLTNPGHYLGNIPKFINEEGAKIIISGGMGPKAIQYFKEFGIEVIIGVSGKINDIIKQILKGTLKSGNSLCTPGEGKLRGVEKILSPDDEKCE